MSNRGMKKWAPFASLSEQKTELNKMRKMKAMEAKPQISQDTIDKINLIFEHYSNEILTIRYFNNGHVDEILSSFVVDTHNKRIQIESKAYINFIDILDIN